MERQSLPDDTAAPVGAWNCAATFYGAGIKSPRPCKTPGNTAMAHPARNAALKRFSKSESIIGGWQWEWETQPTVGTMWVAKLSLPYSLKNKMGVSSVATS